MPLVLAFKLLTASLGCSSERPNPGQLPSCKNIKSGIKVLKLGRAIVVQVKQVDCVFHGTHMLHVRLSLLLTCFNGVSTVHGMLVSTLFQCQYSNC